MAQSLRDLKRERTRRALFDTAIRLFLERGYERTSVEEICREAEYAPSTFFRHFATKEDVVFYDERDWMLRYTELGKSGADLWEAIRQAVFETTAAFFDPDPETARARLRLWLEVPALSRRYGEVCTALEEIIASRLADKFGLDVDADLYPRVAAGAILAAARAGVRKAVLEGGSLVEHIQVGLDLLEPALRHPPAVKRRRKTAG